MKRTIEIERIEKYIMVTSIKVFNRYVNVEYVLWKIIENRISAIFAINVAIFYQTI